MTAVGESKRRHTHDNGCRLMGNSAAISPGEKEGKFWVVLRQHFVFICFWEFQKRDFLAGNLWQNQSTLFNICTGVSSHKPLLRHIKQKSQKEATGDEISALTWHTVLHSCRFSHWQECKIPHLKLWYYAILSLLTLCIFLFPLDCFFSFSPFPSSPLAGCLMLTLPVWIYFSVNIQP